MTRIGTGRSDESEALRARLADAEETLRAIRHGEVDALVVEGIDGNQVYTLHSAEEPYRTLVEQMQEGAAVFTRGGDILYANARFAALVEEPLEAVLGSRVERFITAPERKAFEALIRAGAGRLRSSVTRGGSGTRQVSLSLTATASVHGDRLNLIVTDLSELLEANSVRDRAVLVSRTKDDFLAMLAHELRTPLGAIGNAVRILESTHAERGSASRAREVIGRQVAHVSRLVDDLLDVERVVSGKVQVNPQPLDMADVVRGVVATFTDDPRLDRDIDVIGEPVWVQADPVRLGQILSNLVANAVKYTPPGGRIQVALSAEGHDAVVTVEDTGFGISPELLPFIFDLYVQAERTLARARGGLGIGLTLVRRLVELHGGTIAASSEGEGKGSRFTLRLPRIPALARAPSVLVDSRARPRRVLLIEDSEDSSEMLRVMLELAGHKVYAASDGVRGLELLNTVRPDVGIIDIGLPGMDGHQVARRIRAEPHGREMLLVALSGYDPAGTAKSSAPHGFDHYLVKPVDLDRLAHLVGAAA